MRLGLALALNKNGELGAANEHWAALLAAQGGGRADASVRSKPSEISLAPAETSQAVWKRAGSESELTNHAGTN